MERPTVWRMIREAVEQLGSPVAYSAIREYLHSKYGDVNKNTLNAQLTICTVNNPSRVHFPENKKPRQCTSQHDFLFRTGKAEVAIYDPAAHGKWEIRHDQNGKLVVGQADIEDGDDEVGSQFAVESHLRDFLERNLTTIRMDGLALKVYQDGNGRDGIEYPTEVGPIDILAVDEAGNFVVIELKVSRGPDRALGQALRYMGWVTKHLAAGKRVTGMIVACNIDQKLKYAASVSPDIALYEYKIRFDLSPVALL